MTTAGIRIMIAAAGLAAGLAVPAFAQVSPADGQAIARSLAGQGYSDVRIAEEDGEVIVSATREGETRSFAYDREEGRLEPLGGDEDNRRGDDGHRGSDDDGPGDDGRSGRDRGDDGDRGDDDEGADGNDHGGGDGGHGGDDDGGGGGDDDGGSRGSED